MGNALPVELHGYTRASASRTSGWVHEVLLGDGHGAGGRGLVHLQQGLPGVLPRGRLVQVTERQQHSDTTWGDVEGTRLTLLQLVCSTPSGDRYGSTPSNVLSQHPWSRCLEMLLIWIHSKPKWIKASAYKNTSSKWSLIDSGFKGYPPWLPIGSIKALCHLLNLLSLLT